MRFLQGLKWDYQKTYDQVNEHHQWRQTVNITNPEPFLNHLNQGLIYSYMRDRQCRPIVVINTRKVLEAKMELEQLVAMVDYFTHYTIEHGMCPGKVENWTCIFDLRDVGSTQIPTKHIQGIVKAMSLHYRGRLFRFFATDVNWLVRGLWKMAHRMVDEFTNRKLLIYGDDYRKDLHELVDPANLEQKYGGTRPDKVDNFWPPQFI